MSLYSFGSYLRAFYKLGAKNRTEEKSLHVIRGRGFRKCMLSKCVVIRTHHTLGHFHLGNQVDRFQRIPEVLNRPDGACCTAELGSAKDECAHSFRMSRFKHVPGVWGVEARGGWGKLN